MKLKMMLVILAVMLSFNSLEARHTLFRNGKSSYTIVLPSDPSASERTAARELQEYIRQIGGAEIPVASIDSIRSGLFSRKTRIYVGWNERTGVQQPAADDEGFTVRGKGPSIFIYGGKDRGTMYGVYSFLEKEFGVRWYTPECTVVPQTSRYSYSKFEYSEAPALKYRFVQYNNANRDEAWMAHNRNNSAWTVADNEYGGISAYWSAHTFGYFVPADKYFKEHPEYFSVKDGKRIPNGQLCLTNPDVLEICKEGMKKVIAENPLYWVYSLSQNDNMLPCECDECKALEERYGGHSGAMVWFVNQVADEIKPLFPEKYIGTFAYQYTRHAPENIVPKDNVVIRLCSIECDFSHPIDSTEYNRPFMDDLEAWASKAPNLFIWDYVVNFNQYLAPYPNFQSLASNIRTFRDHKAIGIQEEANYQSDGGEFSEMKAWVLAKLLWNPELDTDALVDEFIGAYYGPAAASVHSYFDLCRAQVKDDTVMGFAFDQNHSLYDDGFISKAWEYVQSARAEASGDEELMKRVDRVAAQILFLKVTRNIEASRADGSMDELFKIIDSQELRVREWQTTEDFKKSLQ